LDQLFFRDVVRYLQELDDVKVIEGVDHGCGIVSVCAPDAMSESGVLNEFVCVEGHGFHHGLGFRSGSV
jgi:hypothetical protein